MAFQAQEMLADERERVPSRMGKTASSMSLREAVKSGLGMDRNRTVPRRFGASPHAEREKEEREKESKREEKKERRMSLFKLFKGKK